MEQTNVIAMNKVVNNFYSEVNWFLQVYRKTKKLASICIILIIRSSNGDNTRRNFGQWSSYSPWCFFTASRSTVRCLISPPFSRPCSPIWLIFNFGLKPCSCWSSIGYCSYSTIDYSPVRSLLLSLF